MSDVDDRKLPDLIGDLPTQTMSGRMMLEDLFGGEENATLRHEIVSTGKYAARNGKKELRIQTRATDDGKHEIVALAALSRDPGKSSDYLETVADFSGLGLKPTTNLSVKVKQYREIYRHEGIINNAVNKIAALIGVGGRYKVRHARRGKSRKALDDLQMLLDYLTVNVNSASLSGVVTSERGMKSVIHSGVRHALVEGDWVARQQWTKVKLGTVGEVSLPLTLQTISISNLEPVVELSGLGELWYWKPESSLMNLITNGSKVKEINDVIQDLVDNKMRAELKKNQKVLLTPALLLHVKHRGFATDPVGESIIESAKLGIRFSRSLTAVDLVSMENVINRLTIVQVGSADPKSPYSKADVAAARAALMQSFFEDISPSMVIVWQGDDVKVTDVGSSQSVLELNERYRIADQKIKMALGLPDALLIGSMGDGSGATWASMVGAAAQMQELANSFASVLTTLGERVAMENGYDGVDLLWEFDASLMADYKDTRTQNRSDYVLGLASIHSMIAAAGRDPDAEFLMKCKERDLNPDTTTFEEAFSPPQGLQGQAPGGIQGQGEGKDPGAGREKDDGTRPDEPTAE
jgi:hypothetical protein